MTPIELIRLFIWPSWKQTYKLVTLAILSIMAGVALVVSIFNANESIIEQFNYSNSLIQGQQSAYLQNTNNSFTGKSLGTALLKQLQEYDFVPVLERKLYDKDNKQVLTILGVDFLNDYRFRQYSFQEENPKLSALLDSENGGVVLSQSAKEKLGLPNKDKTFLYGSKEISLKVSSLTLKNIGLAKAEGGLIAIGNISYVQKLLNEPDTFSALEFINVKPESLQNALKLPPGYKVYDPSQRRKEIESLTSAFRFNLQALSFIALLVAAYLIFQTIFISFQRKGKLLGIIRVLGFTNKQAFCLLWLESSLIGLIGVSLGCLCGLFLSFFILHTLQQTVNELYFSVKSTQLLLSSRGILIGACAGLFTSIFAGLPTAYLALKTEPAVNMRGLAFKNFRSISQKLLYGFYGIGLLCLFILAVSQRSLFQIQNKYIGFGMALVLLIGLGLVSGFLLSTIHYVLSKIKTWFGQLLSVRLAANYLRLWIATGALVCGLSMTISVSLMIDSFRLTVQDWINDTLKADIYISSIYQNEEGLNKNLISQLTQWPEIKALDYLSKHTANIDGKPAIVGGANLKVQLPILKFVEIGNLKVFNNSPALNFNFDEAIVSNTFALKHSLHVGNTFKLPSKLGLRTMKVEGIYQDYSSEHGYILMTREVYSRLFDNNKITNLALYLKDESQIKKVQNNLQQLQVSKLFGLQNLKIQTNSELRKTILSIFDQTFQISYLFFWISLAISILTVSLTLFSCIEENAYLNVINRYLGITITELAIMEIGQGLLITLLALALSIPGGYWLAHILQNTINNHSFGWIIYLHTNWTAILFISALALLGSLFGSIIPLWLSRKLIVSNTATRELS